MHSLRLEPRRDWELLLPVQNAFLPTMATILLKQHAGKPARRVVDPGDRVREGMVLGVPDGELSSYIHSPIPGTVRSVSTQRLPNGEECEAIEIYLQGSFDRLGKRPERYVWKGMRRSDILQTLKAKGVVETRGIGLPLEALLEGKAKGCSIVVTALDREPYLRTESAIIESRMSDVVEALRMIASVVEAASLTILVNGEEPKNWFESLSPLLAATDTSPAIQTHRIPGFQTGGADGFRADRDAELGGKELRLLPSTLVAVYDAVVEAKAFVERYITVAGGAIRHPAVLKARIGTPVGDLIEECGGFIESPERLVFGGPLTGLPARDLDMPVTKTTGGFLALTAPETNRGKVRPCIRCGRCREFCPVGIDPESIFRDLVGGGEVEARARGLDSCIACGICSYVCPSRIELSQSLHAHSGGGR